MQNKTSTSGFVFHKVNANCAAGVCGQV